MLSNRHVGVLCSWAVTTHQANGRRTSAFVNLSHNAHPFSGTSLLIVCYPVNTTLFLCGLCSRSAKLPPSLSYLGPAIMRAQLLRPNAVLILTCLLVLVLFLLGIAVPNAHLWGSFLLPVVLV